MYNVREGSEQADLSADVEASVDTDELRSQFMAKKKTAVEEWFEDDEVSQARAMLLRQLSLRFGEVPNELTDRVQSTKAKKTLNTWLERFATATRIEDIGIIGRK